MITYIKTNNMKKILIAAMLLTGINARAQVDTINSQITFLDSFVYFIHQLDTAIYINKNDTILPLNIIGVYSDGVLKVIDAKWLINKPGESFRIIGAEKNTLKNLI